MTPVAIHAPAFAQVDLIRLRSCIAAVESNNRSLAVGPHGERGLYQFTAAAWRETTDLPFCEAFDRIQSAPVALKRLQVLRIRLLELGRDPSVRNLALAWKIGLDGEVTPAAESYAERVGNLYKDK